MPAAPFVAAATEGGSIFCLAFDADLASAISFSLALQNCQLDEPAKLIP